MQENTLTHTQHIFIGLRILFFVLFFFLFFLNLLPYISSYTGWIGLYYISMCVMLFYFLTSRILSKIDNNVGKDGKHNHMAVALHTDHSDWNFVSFNYGHTLRLLANNISFFFFFLSSITCWLLACLPACLWVNDYIFYGVREGGERKTENYIYNAFDTERECKWRVDFMGISILHTHVRNSNEPVVAPITVLALYVLYVESFAADHMTYVWSICGQAEDMQSCTTQTNWFWKAQRNENLRRASCSTRSKEVYRIKFLNGYIFLISFLFFFFFFIFVLFI